MQIRVDGAPCQADADETLLAVLRRLGHAIPSLCDDARLAPQPVCRLCVVEVAGIAHPVAACATHPHPGMEVRTGSPEIDAHRRQTLALLARRQPRAALDDPVESEFARLIRAFGLESELRGSADPALVDDAHPYIHVDMSRCVDCYRCVRVCAEVQGQFVWQEWHRGDRVRIRPDSGTTLLASSCVACGACVTACPSGALQDQTVRRRGVPTAHTRSVCPYCGVGCEIDVGTRDGRITRITPAADAPVNRGHLCVKGRYAFEFVEHRDRLRTPLLRTAAGWQAVAWADAVAFIAERLRGIVARHGPDAVAVLGSARATNEENYVAQKFARVALGTNNVDCCARVCHAPSAQALTDVLGTGAATSAFDDIELARTILVCGANPTDAHPVIGARIRQQARRGANLIVVDPRRIELAREPGALHLAAKPGMDVPVLNALACAIVEQGLADMAFLAAHVDGWPAFRAHVAAFRPEDVGPAAGVAPALLREAARRYASETPSIAFNGIGMTEHVHGTDGVTALINLALLTGNLGRPGSGVNPLRGQTNVQGAVHMGCEPGALTGSAPLRDAAARVAGAWGAPVPDRPGLRLPAMLEAATRGALKGLWAIGYDVLLSNPNGARTRASLAAVELLVVQDIFLNETARELAHVVLPSACAFEKDGTFMNAERRVQRVRKAVEPPGAARPDWQPLCEVARAMGHADAFAFTSAEQIWEEVRRVWPAGRGMTYARLERGGLQWPCPDETHPGTARLHDGAFAAGQRATLRCLAHRPSPEVASPDYPFILVTGRSLYQFNVGTMTMRTANRMLHPTDRLEISPADAAAQRVADGERVRVESRYGSAVLPVQVSDAAAPGELFASFADPAVFLNLVTGPWRDARVDTPEYKLTAVRLARA
ncbi:MAG: formate dehydrogenase subunit alpha [Deltaproteobacteria bacterium]|nr:formate dehydrogenase subunit alpha [Deltaproteobacteria bacterium]